MSEQQARDVVEFLAEFGFVDLIGGDERVKLSDAVRELIAETDA